MSKKDAAWVGLLVAIAGVVFTAVALPGTKLLIGFAVIAFLIGGLRTWDRASILDPIRIVAIVVCLVSVVVLLINAAGGEDEKNLSAPDPRHEASPGKVLHVYNRVTSGPRKMREDDEHPIYLSTKAEIDCAERHCRIPETNRETGDTFDEAVCQREGERTTNGDDASRIDDHNPGLFSSRRYYGVRLDEDTFGYVSEVWIDAKQRGGLDLPSC